MWFNYKYCEIGIFLAVKRDYGDSERLAGFWYENLSLLITPRYNS